MNETEAELEKEIVLLQTRLRDVQAQIAQVKVEIAQRRAEKILFSNWNDVEQREVFIEKIECVGAAELRSFFRARLAVPRAWKDVATIACAQDVNMEYEYLFRTHDRGTVHVKVNNPALFQFIAALFTRGQAPPRAHCNTQRARSTDDATLQLSLWIYT